MAKAKKQSRNIVVDATPYRWRATGSDYTVAVTIWPADSDGPIITAHIPYQETSTPNGTGGWSLSNQIVVTNRLVRRLIKLAVDDHQYDPSKRGLPVQIRGDDAIELSDAVRAVKSNRT